MTKLPEVIQLPDNKVHVFFKADVVELPVKSKMPLELLERSKVEEVYKCGKHLIRLTKVKKGVEVVVRKGDAKGVTELMNEVFV